MGFSDQQVRMFVKRIIKSHGRKWGYVADDVKQAIVSSEVLAIIGGQDSETIKVSDINDLRSRVEAYFFPEVKP